MPKPDNGDQTLPRVGVKSDASNMDTAQLVLAIDDGEGAFMDQLWENCYLFSDWYRRKEWTVGLNSRPRNFHFVQYVQQRFPKRGYTENDLMTRIDCYNTYARVPDAEPAVALIKQMGSLTKAHTAIPWVQRFPGKATEILQVCLSTSAVELRAALRVKFPLKASAMPQRRERQRGTGVSSEGVLNYLAGKPVNVIANEMFIPRNDAIAREIEYAWCSVAKVGLTKFDMSAADLYGHMVEAWINSLDPTTRSEILDVAHSDWLTLMDWNDGDATMWPFAEPDGSSPEDDTQDTRDNDPAKRDRDYFGLPPNFTEDDLQTAYRQKAKDTHPDTGGSDAAFRECTEAYERLKPHARTREYA